MATPSYKKRSSDAGRPYQNVKIVEDSDYDEETPMILRSSSSSGCVSTWWASMCSALTFAWFTPVLESIQSKVNVGEHPDLEDAAIPPLPPEDRTAEVKCKFEALWTTEQKNSPQDPSLIRTMWKYSARPLLRAIGLLLVNSVTPFFQPYFLKWIVPYLKEPSPSFGEGLGMTAILFLASIVGTVTNQYATYLLSRVGLRGQTGLKLLIFQKALKIDSTFYQDHPAGQVLNLMSTDAGAVSSFLEYVNYFITLPFQIIVAIVALWMLLGPSCLGGIFVMIVITPLTNRLSKWLFKYSQKLMNARDDRCNCNQETISNMKIIKYQAWEEAFREKVEAFRNAEIRQYFIFKLVNAVFGVLSTATPSLVCLFSFALYVTVQEKVLDAGTALSAISVFNILRGPLTILPLLVNFGVDCGVSLQRIKNYLIAPDYEPPLRLTNGEVDDKNGGVRVIELKDATFSYQRLRPRANEENDSSLQGQLNKTEKELLLAKAKLADAEEQMAQLEGRSLAQYGSTGPNPDNDGFKKILPLRRVNFECSEGEFIAVVGGVGSGKSTLLKALLGEVQKVSGEVRIQGDIAYFEQNPFIMNSTWKDNILFGKDEENVDEGLYRLAVKASCLEPDIKRNPEGDQSSVGEKGFKLSGGQKARVAIARAVYRDADISLVDDCLAAVDAHVGSELFNKCIVDVLLKRNIGAKRKKTVILATNNLQYLSHPMLNRIVVLKDGVVVESGSYSDLVALENSLFKSMVDSFNESSNVNSKDSETQDEEYYDSEEEDYFDEGAFEETFSGPPEIANFAEMCRTSSIRTLSTRSSFRRSSRRSSVLSAISSTSNRKSSVNEKNLQHAAKHISNEMAEGQVGKVNAELYMVWAKAAGGVWVVIPLFVVFVIPQFTDIWANRWITEWGESAEPDESSQLHYLLVLALIYLAAASFSFVRSSVPVLFSLRASKKFFSAMLDTLLAVPMSFYDNTPTGVVQNRFSKDFFTLDGSLVSMFGNVMISAFTVLSTLFLLLAANPWVVVALPFLMAFYKHQYDLYGQGNRELKRVDSTRRSPVFNLFSEALTGYCTIRAFEAGPFLLNRMCVMVSKEQHSSYLMRSGSCWLGVRLEFVGTCLATLGGFAFVALSHFKLEGADESLIILAGTVLPFVLNINSSLTSLVKNLINFEADMVSVERVHQYIQLEREAPRQTPADSLLEKDWPSKGSVEFKNVNMRYQPGMPLVLKGLNVTIPSKARVGVCGRTGAGKSTLTTALMRLVELDEGQIFLDGVDIKTVGLTTLRSNIAIVPQDCVIFSGTVQTNIDPFDKHSEDKLMDVLDRVGLLGSIKSIEDPVELHGSNFSAGQRQLLVIARALLNDASLVIFDEATASIDAETDARVQKIFRTDFAQSTTLTIAHRLNTIMDSTHILVMDDGKAAEFDTPSTLLSRDSIFKELFDAFEKEHQ